MRGGKRSRWPFNWEELRDDGLGVLATAAEIGVNEAQGTAAVPSLRAAAWTERLTANARDYSQRSQAVEQQSNESDQDIQNGSNGKRKQSVLFLLEGKW